MIFATILNLLAFVIYYTTTVHGAGFPDGHLTEFERAASTLFTALLPFACLLALHQIHIIKNKHSKDVQTGVIANIVCTLLVSGALYGGTVLLYASLNHGQGG